MLTRSSLNQTKEKQVRKKMSYQLIGSSNIARFYKRSLYKDNKPYILMKCTRMKGFELMMSETEADYIIVSVIENFMVDAVGEDLTNGKEIVDQLIKDFGATLRATAERLPETKIAVVMPMRRPVVDWYEDQIPAIRRTISSTIEGLQMVKVGCIEGSLSATQHFEKDGVHLTKESGENFVNIILERAEDFFRAESIDLTKDDNDKNKTETSQVRMEQLGLNTTMGRIERLEAEMRDMKRLRMGDQLMFARLREDADFEKNRQKEDRIVISRLKVKNVPKEFKGRIEFLKLTAAGLFEFLVPGFAGKILWITHGRFNEATSSLTFLEVKMDSTKNAMDIRKAFVKKLRSKELSGDYENIFITNCVTKATRVRIDIMRAIARKTTTDQEAAFVASFISRPVLQFKKIIPGEMTYPYKSFTFVEAIIRFRNEITDTDLDEAYEKASMFDTELEQNFIVLTSAGLRSHSLRSRAQDAQSGRGFRGGRGGRGWRGGHDGRGGRGGRGGFGAGSGSGSNSISISNNNLKRHLDNGEDNENASSKMMKK